MSLVRSFADWLQDQGIATLGQDLFISLVPESPDTAYWLKSNGGGQVAKTVDGLPTRRRTVQLFFRSRNPKEVEDNLDVVDDLLSLEQNFNLYGYNVADVEVSGAYIDQDIDNQSRSVGLLEVTITIYKGVTNVIS